MERVPKVKKISIERCHQRKYSYGIDCSKDIPFQISTLNIIHLSIPYFDHGMYLLTAKQNTVHTYKTFL